MSEPKSSTSTVKYTLLFMVVLSLVCALILSILASALAGPQEEAKELDRSKEMLISAQILNSKGYFQIRDKDGKEVPAKMEKGGELVASDGPQIPSSNDILEVYRTRIQPFLVDEKGDETTFQKAGIDEDKYLAEYRKTGYYRQPYRLIYKIFTNPSSEPGQEMSERPIEGYVIPVNGMGLWDAIYGYLAIKPNGDNVIGISWYDQKETPGLGANISEPEWQSQFPGKLVFQEGADGKTDFQTASLGIIVVKGKVNEVLGNSPKAKSAVDGMAGATLTGNGVTDAYKNVLAAYRPFLLKLAEKEME